MLQIRTDHVLPTHGIFNVDVPANISTIYQDRVSAALEQVILEKLMPVFLQAVIDDDRKKVAELLGKNPELLQVKALKGIKIQSQYTWLTIDAENENALSIAAKRKQIKMIELLLPYYDKLEQSEDVIRAKAEGLAAWKAYEIQKNAEGEDEIIIPKEYADYAQSLIDVFKDETFTNGVPGGKDANGHDVPYNVVLSDKTELALTSLLNILVPKTAVKLDEHIDEELLLLAIYKAYVKNFATFNYNRDKSLCIRLMGLTQSALIPETGEIYCEGLTYVVIAINNRKEKEISPLAASHTFKGGESFYRDSRDSRSGSGFDFLTGIFGGVAGGRASNGGVGWPAISWLAVWKNYVEQKQQLFGTLRSNCNDSQTNLQVISNRAV